MHVFSLLLRISACRQKSHTPLQIVELATHPCPQVLSHFPLFCVYTLTWGSDLILAQGPQRKPCTKNG